jgi:hypothetical protein
VAAAAVSRGGQASGALGKENARASKDGNCWSQWCTVQVTPPERVFGVMDVRCYRSLTAFAVPKLVLRLCERVTAHLSTMTLMVPLSRWGFMTASSASPCTW